MSLLGVTSRHSSILTPPSTSRKNSSRVNTPPVPPSSSRFLLPAMPMKTTPTPTRASSRRSTPSKSWLIGGSSSAMPQAGSCSSSSVSPLRRASASSSSSHCLREHTRLNSTSSATRMLAPTMTFRWIPSRLLRARTAIAMRTWTATKTSRYLHCYIFDVVSCCGSCTLV